MNIRNLFVWMARVQTLAVLCLFASNGVFAREATVSSPNGKLLVSVTDDGQKPTYTVTLDGRQMLLPSALGEYWRLYPRAENN